VREEREFRIISVYPNSELSMLKRVVTKRSWMIYFLIHNCFRWNKSTRCSVHLLYIVWSWFSNVQCNQWFNNEQFHKRSRTFKEAGKYSRKTGTISLFLVISKLHVIRG